MGFFWDNLFFYLFIKLYLWENFLFLTVYLSNPSRRGQGARGVFYMICIATTQNTPECCYPYYGLYYGEHILNKYPKISRLYP